MTLPRLPRILAFAAVLISAIWIALVLPILEGLDRLGLALATVLCIVLVGALLVGERWASRHSRRLTVAAALALGGAAAIHAFRAELVGMFGPKQVVMREVFERRPDGPRIDHTAWEAVLARCVDDRGLVDYAALQADPADLERYLETLATADLDKLGRDEMLALLVNAYNAFTLELVLERLPIESIRDIPSAERWDARRWQLGPHVVSLTELEHDWLRSRFVDPRIHFAINCASVGCPPLARTAFHGETIEAELEAHTRRVHADQRWFEYDPGSHDLELTRIYLWYAGDFEQVADSVAHYAARWSGPLQADLDAEIEPSIEWLDYDWSLNSTTTPR